jgi:hypothetical protein
MHNIARQHRKFIGLKSGQDWIDGGHEVAAQLHRADDSNHARLLSGSLGIDTKNLGMGMGAANKDNMQGLRQHNIIAKTGAAPHKGAILPAQGRIHLTDGLSAVAISQSLMPF